MRSRYTAYAMGSGDHLFRTWHPRTRPADIEPDQALTWIGLDVVDVVDGAADDTGGIVEFRAHWRSGEEEPAVRHAPRTQHLCAAWWPLGLSWCRDASVRSSR